MLGHFARGGFPTDNQRLKIRRRNVASVKSVVSAETETPILVGIAEDNASSRAKAR